MDNKEQLFNSILNEADDSYIAKVGGLYLQGKDLTSDPEEADVFESKTEPTQRINQMKKDGKIKKNKKITIIKEYISNQTVNAFMRHGVEKYFHEDIILIDDEWYTPCEFIEDLNLENDFGPEYIFEQVAFAVKESISRLRKQGIQPDENADDEAYNLWEMIDFIGSLKESKKHTMKESKAAAYALTKLKSLLKFDTRWEYDGDGEPYLVDNENEPPLYTVQWTGKESGSHQGFYSVDVEEGDEWDSTIYNFSDARSAYQKIEDVMKLSKLLEAKGDFKRYAQIGGAAAALLGLGALKVGDIKDIKSKADELNIKVPAIEYISSHRDAQLIRPIYDYKYDNKGPLNIESLCKWLERNTEFENVGYEEDGDNYVIKYRNVYYSYADDSSNPKRKTTYGKIDLPKSYFDDWTYSLDENKKIALFDKLLKG